MRIDGYSFGGMTLGGRTHRRDLLLFPGLVLPGWRRGEGHRLAVEDLGEVLERPPDTLVIGTGAMGRMEVPVAVRALLESRGIVVLALKTGEAVKVFNERLARGERVAGAFHLTC